MLSQSQANVSIRNETPGPSTRGQKEMWNGHKEGDIVEVHNDSDWIKGCVKTLKENGNIGVVIDGNIEEDVFSINDVRKPDLEEGSETDEV